MANQHGDFIWYELLTADTDAAARFYGAVVGWQAREAEGSVRGYGLFGTGGTDIAGFMRIPADAERAGMRPRWLGYIGVRDVDATVAEIVQAGGAQHMPPTDIPGVGRLAMVTDPQGVAFYVMRGAVDGTSTSFSPTQPGHCHWNELATSDEAAALAFYTRLFGWEQGDAMPMGEMGDYRFIHHGGQMIGAVMNRSKDAPPAMWNYYFRVDGIDAAATRIRENGGTITFGPMEVPGGDMVLNAMDPQGAAFSLHAKKAQ